MQAFINQLKLKYGDDVIQQSERMSGHTSFKIGGPAEVMCIPESVDQLLSLVSDLKVQKMPILFMGNGSNLLVPDHGIRGAVVKICEGFKTAQVAGVTIVAEAGCLLSSLSTLALENSLTGLEFASGIPGTLGGAVFMNAGAYGGEMQHVIKSVTVMDSQGQVVVLSREKLEFGYRWSNIQEQGAVVLSAVIELTRGDVEVIKETLKDLTYKRTSKQPLELPSAGSVFKRPVGYYAGKLIEDAGLRGLRHGDAQVSDKHCGFIVNLGHSNYKEVTELIKTVQKVVLDTTGVVLETEIRIL
jgi:UDP-N-acetylmuramate dehydrogenase